MEDRQRSVRDHLETALSHLDIDQQVDRLQRHRHTDHDRHIYLPNHVARELSVAYDELEAALAELWSITSPPGQEPPPSC